MGATRYDIKTYDEYKNFLSSLGGDNKETLGTLKKNLRRALTQELTTRQRVILELYFIGDLKMVQIAERLDINVSTVSRTLRRALSRLQRCVKYGAKELLYEDREASD